MTVDPRTAPAAEVDGVTDDFCAEYCRELFVSNPTAFAAHPRADGG